MSNRLPYLKAELAKAHAEFEHALGTAAERAIAAGEMLVEAKSLCPHGTWTQWLSEAGIPERSAQRYMRLHQAGFKSDMVSDLGLVAAERIAGLAKRLPFPREGEAVCFTAREDEDAMWRTAVLSYWWPGGDGLFGYWHLSTTRDEPIRIRPRKPVPRWLIALLHDGDNDMAATNFARLPVADAMAQMAKLAELGEVM